MNGAADPTSGNVALMETARGLGELLKTGWRPKRTIILASWDGEEWGLLGSTEWAEKHAAGAARRRRSPTSTATAPARAGSSVSRLALAAGVRQRGDARRRRIRTRAGKTLLRGQARSRARARPRPTTDKAAHRGARDFPIDALGSGSDYTAFLDYLTIASLNLGFGGEGRTAASITPIYDSFYWYTHFSDSDFAYGAALSRTIGTAMLRLADADILPFEFTATARHAARLRRRDREAARRTTHGTRRRSTRRRCAAADRSPARRRPTTYERALGAVAATRRRSTARKLVELNRLLYTIERALQVRRGPAAGASGSSTSPTRPGFYTGYGVKTLPGIREGIEQKAVGRAEEVRPDRRGRDRQAGGAGRSRCGTPRRRARVRDEGALIRRDDPRPRGDAGGLLRRRGFACARRCGRIDPAIMPPRSSDSSPGSSRSRWQSCSPSARAIGRLASPS